mmetsp:Transcript_39800/g.102505  ORF Transcript_39800/g.102505 Transcript_39800/m.102505 type:complete len:298 (+) Transcript_39800:5687-6580(+)
MSREKGVINAFVPGLLHPPRVQDQGIVFSIEFHGDLVGGVSGPRGIQGNEHQGFVRGGLNEQLQRKDTDLHVGVLEVDAVGGIGVGQSAHVALAVHHWHLVHVGGKHGSSGEDAHDGGFRSIFLVTHDRISLFGCIRASKHAVHVLDPHAAVGRVLEEGLGRREGAGASGQGLDFDILDPAIRGPRPHSPERRHAILGNGIHRDELGVVDEIGDAKGVRERTGPGGLFDSLGLVQTVRNRIDLDHVHGNQVIRKDGFETAHIDGSVAVGKGKGDAAHLELVIEGDDGNFPREGYSCV